ncbi:putative NAD-dependent lysine demalonylase, desuccinylase and deglutarylase [Lyophyllum shimeji]|uniref:NAD-dependent protein deacylase n=1 Tax=Lyophyllum shimeji TaxID=47721 RepID=A0A9P3PCL4_LYOSH|nr:putative NAD-dependent lysine demalonylase, desuccinylase and deglutarylase [Lyophyllum shimeji]
MPSHDMNSFQTVLRSSKHIIAIAGAGLSVASGIPTFRGAGGLWRKYDAMSLATPGSFRRDPSLVWQFYHYRREVALKAMPNPAHLALASFSLPQTRALIAPDSTFTLITQNVDGLSARASQQVQSAQPQFLDVPDDTQTKLLEMHGRLFDVRCTSAKCGHTEFNTTSPICASLAGTELAIAAGDADHAIPVVDLPRCSECGALARPGVVWFEEVPLHLDVIENLVDQADLCLVVGTSSTLYPAAGYASEVQEHGGTVAVFNLEHSAGDEEADFLFLGPCEETLPKALGLTSVLYS